MEGMVAYTHSLLGTSNGLVHLVPSWCGEVGLEPRAAAILQRVLGFVFRPVKYLKAGSPCCCPCRLLLTGAAERAFQKSLIMFRGIIKTQKSYSSFFLLLQTHTLAARDVSLNISSGKINEVN